MWIGTSWQFVYSFIIKYSIVTALGANPRLSCTVAQCRIALIINNLHENTVVFCRAVRLCFQFNSKVLKISIIFIAISPIVGAVHQQNHTKNVDSDSVHDSCHTGFILLLFCAKHNHNSGATLKFSSDCIQLIKVIHGKGWLTIKGRYW